MSAPDPKKHDLPPHGDRNADPITDQAGAHPVEVGVGAALAGAATGVAAGAVAGPVGAAIGAVVGAVAGGLAGKGVGEHIDPTTADSHLRDTYASRPYAKAGSYESHVPAYQYGGQAEAKYPGESFDAVEDRLKSDWSNKDMPWGDAAPAVRDGYERSGMIRTSRKG